MVKWRELSKKLNAEAEDRKKGRDFALL